MNVRHLSTLTLCAAFAASLSTVQAQNEPPTRQQPVQGQQPDHRTGNQDRNGAPATAEVDKILASWLLIDNNNEIELAKIAQQRAQNPEVKQFAAMMIKDHGEFATKLQPFSGAGAMHGVNDDGSKGTAGTDTTGRTDRGVAGGTDRTNPAGTVDASSQRSGMNGNGEFNHLALVRELGQECLASARKELEGKTGAEFDRCYVGMQIMAHAGVLDKLQVFGRHSSPQLKQTLQQGEQTVQTHLQKAKSIAKQLEQGSSDKASSGNGR